MQYKSERTGFKDIDIAMSVMIGALLLGTVFGTLSYCFMPQSTVDLLSGAVKDFVGFRQTADFGHILIRSFFTATLFIGAEFLMGLFALGQLPELLVLIYRGSGLGIILSQAYVNADRSRLVLVILFIVPAAVISCYALSLAAKEAVKMSSRLMTLLLVNKPCPGLFEHFKNYAARFAAIEALAAVSAAVDCISSLLIASKL